MQTQMPSTPLLSVTVLNYNYGHYLPTSLDSILKQTFTDFELILINDTSTDNSLEVIQPYLSDPRVRLVDHTENKGFVRSLIEGSELSRGKYITVISADDWSVDLTAFEKQIAILEQNPNVAYVFSGYGFYEDEQHCTGIAHSAPASYIREGRDTFQEFVLERVMLHSGTMIRKTAYEKIGGYNPALRYALDAQIWIGLCHAGQVAYISDVMYAYRRHGTNMSTNKAVVVQSIKELLQIMDWAFGMLPPADRRELDWLYKKAVRQTLSDYPIGYIFEHQYRLGWYFFWKELQLRPVETLFQKMIFILILRTALGVRGYRLLEQIKALINGRTRARLAAEDHKT